MDYAIMRIHNRSLNIFTKKKKKGEIFVFGARQTSSIIMTREQAE